MTANELRIGNWVEFQAANGAWYPRSFEITDYRDFEDENTSYRAIPLTEEVLLKCGFFQNNGVASREFLLINGEQVIKMVNHHEDGWLFIPNWWKVGKMIKSLHQLQNLYFALTGQELDYTP